MPRPNWNDLASPRCPVFGRIDEVFRRASVVFVVGAAPAVGRQGVPARCVPTGPSFEELVGSGELSRSLEFQ
jgi:hypothetical protein